MILYRGVPPPFNTEVPLLVFRGMAPGTIEVERGREFGGVDGVDGRATGVPEPALGRDALSLCRVLIGNFVLLTHWFSCVGISRLAGDNLPAGGTDWDRLTKYYVDMLAWVGRNRAL